MVQSDLCVNDNSSKECAPRLGLCVPSGVLCPIEHAGFRQPSFTHVSELREPHHLPINPNKLDSSSKLFRHLKPMGTGYKLESRPRLKGTRFYTKSPALFSFPGDQRDAVQSPGELIYVVDFDASQVQILAYMARCPGLLGALKRGDVYESMSATGDRDKGKGIVLKHTLNVWSYTKHQRFRGLYPKAAAYMDHLFEIATRGYWLRCDGELIPSKKAAYSLPTQHLWSIETSLLHQAKERIASHNLQGLTFCFSLFDALGYRSNLDPGEVCSLLKKEMEAQGVMRASVEVGSSWGEAGPRTAGDEYETPNAIDFIWSHLAKEKPTLQRTQRQSKSLEIWSKALPVSKSRAALAWLEKRGISYNEKMDPYVRWCEEKQALVFRYVSPIGDPVLCRFRALDGGKPQSLRGESQRGSCFVIGDPATASEVVIAEGETDTLSWVVWWLSLPEGTTGAVIGLVVGSWSELWGEVLDPTATIFIRTDTNEAGHKYARNVRATLKNTHTIYRKSGVDGPDDNDLLSFGQRSPSNGCHRVHASEALDPAHVAPCVAEGKSVDVEEAINRNLLQIKRAKHGSHNNTINSASFHVGQISHLSRRSNVELLEALSLASDGLYQGGSTTAARGFSDGQEKPSTVKRQGQGSYVIPEHRNTEGEESLSESRETLQALMIESIKSKGASLVKASLGAGKSTAAIRAALQALDKGTVEKVLWITPTNDLCAEAFKKIKVQALGHDVRLVAARTEETCSQFAMYLAARRASVGGSQKFCHQCPLSEKCVYMASSSGALEGDFIIMTQSYAVAYFERYKHLTGDAHPLANTAVIVDEDISSTASKSATVTATQLLTAIAWGEVDESWLDVVKAMEIAQDHGLSVGSEEIASLVEVKRSRQQMKGLRRAQRLKAAIEANDTSELDNLLDPIAHELIQRVDPKQFKGGNIYKGVLNLTQTVDMSCFKEAHSLTLLDGTATKISTTALLGADAVFHVVKCKLPAEVKIIVHPLKTGLGSHGIKRTSLKSYQDIINTLRHYADKGTLFIVHKAMLDPLTDIGRIWVKDLKQLAGDRIHFGSTLARGSDLYESSRRVVSLAWFVPKAAIESKADSFGIPSAETARSIQIGHARYSLENAVIEQALGRIRPLNADSNTIKEIIMLDDRAPERLGFKEYEVKGVPVNVRQAALIRLIEEVLSNFGSVALKQRHPDKRVRKLARMLEEIPREYLEVRTSTKARASTHLVGLD